ncbi:hypothetical protein [Nocardia sp. NPDC051981]|uniref:hypothetical protein n=1 Tax=Nocardia sp. NPDC051981 TaxID=3155417 RepID=UPI00343D944A
MAGNTFQGRRIEIIDHDDLSVDQRVFEFTDPAIPEGGSHFAIAVPDPDDGNGSWTDAVVSLHINEVPVDLLLWAIAKAKEISRL